MREYNFLLDIVELTCLNPLACISLKGGGGLGPLPPPSPSLLPLVLLSLVFALTFVSFLQCDTTCGEGIQIREVFCMLNGRVVDLAECAGLDSPATARTCTLAICPGPDGQ